MRYYSRLVPLMRRMHQPIIAAVNGPAYGGGMCLTLGAEIRFASVDAVFNSHRHRQRPHQHRAGRASWLLPRLIGAAHCNDILLTGRKRRRRRGRPRWASCRGWSRRRAAADRARHGRARMCEFSPYGLAMTKDIIWVNLENAEPRGGHRDRGPQPAHARLHREPARGHPGLRPGPHAAVHRRPPRATCSAEARCGTLTGCYRGARPAGGPRERSFRDLRGRCPLHARGNRGGPSWLTRR